MSALDSAEPPNLTSLNSLNGPLWPRRVELKTDLAAVTQAARWASWRARQRAAMRLTVSRTAVCLAVRGFAGMASTRLTNSTSLSR